MKDAKLSGSKRICAWRRLCAAAAILAGGLLGGVLGGCSLIYENRLQQEHFTLYSDLSREFLDDSAASIRSIYGGYSRLFGIEPRDLGNVTFIFQGEASDTQVVDFSYAPALLGYYMPFFELISVDTTPSWAREPDLFRQILLHEIAHHFVIHQHPDVNSRCWLNEGLAGNLEMTLFEGDHFEFPLLNPSLLQIALAALREQGSEISLEKIISMGWNDFHTGDAKEKHYALSWSIVYFLLERHLPADRPLGERIHALCRMDPREIQPLEAQWIEFLNEFNLGDRLWEMASKAEGDGGGARLSSLWAIQQLGSIRCLKRDFALARLIHLLDDADLEKRRASCLSFLRIAAQLPPRALSPDLQGLIDVGRMKIERVLEDFETPVPVRQTLLVEAGKAIPHEPRWVPVLISFLDAPEGDIRAAAAQGLARAEIKPTVTNPAFWRRERNAERQAEVREWRSWWAHHGPSILNPPD